jgi:hypothetical protein
MKIRRFFALLLFVGAMAILLLLIASPLFGQTCTQGQDGSWYASTDRVGISTNSRELCELELFEALTTSYPPGAASGTSAPVGAQICGPDRNEQCVPGGDPKVTEPSYTETPVVTRTPHCDEGYRLQRYSSYDSTQSATFAVPAIFTVHLPGWEPVDEQKPDTTPGPHDGDYRCVKDEVPVLHRRDESGSAVLRGTTTDLSSQAIIGTDNTWATSNATPIDITGAGEFAAIYPAEIALPKGTKCGPEDGHVVCHLPKQGK